jgi:hypothetical protein
MKVSVGFSLECSLFTPKMALAVSTKLDSLVVHSLMLIAFHGLRCWLYLQHKYSFPFLNIKNFALM